MSKPPQPKPADAPLALERPSPGSAAPIHLWRTLGLFVILLATTLLLWRLVLLTPLKALSRGAIQVCFRLLPLPGSGSTELITVDSATGDWIVHGSLLLLRERDITQELAGSSDAGVRMQPAMLQLFSLSLPIYWALALPVWPDKRLWRVLGTGTLLLAVISELSLVLFLAYWINRYFVVASAPWSDFCLRFAGYFTLNVVPYAAPLAMVIWLHPGLRSLVFGGPTWQTRPTRVP
jgi:hypothetical protein